jgi:transglutaminase-like putative cysteine protease
MTTYNITDVYTSKPGSFGTEIKYTPMVGENYRITVEFEVSGTPQTHYPVYFNVADRWAGVEVHDLAPGHKRVSQDFFLPLDGPIPWEVDVDPYHYGDGVDRVKSPIPHTFGDVLGGEGQSVKIGRTAFRWGQSVKKGSFEPAPPPTSIDHYEPVSAVATQSLEVTFPAGPNIQRMAVMFGVPLSEGWQTTSVETCTIQDGAGSAALMLDHVDNASGYPIFFWNRTNLPAKPVSVVADYLLTLRNVRVDGKKLRGVTWAQLDEARKHDPYAFWGLPDAVTESTDPKVTAFVLATLGANYRQKMTPYDAARKLFQAVLAHITYYYPAPGAKDLRPTTAVGMLDKGFGDCGGFSILLVAAFRNIGFAARTACGCWIGLDAGHCWCELYFPGHGWLVCDGAAGNNASESGEFAYYFGNIPDLNIRFATMRGNKFDLGDVETSWLQSPYEQVWGTVHEKSVSIHTMLIEKLALGLESAAADAVAPSVSTHTIEVAARRCPCAQHGGFKPARVRMR